MATDDVTLNVGTGGDSIRTLADANGKEWQAVVASYGVTISPGANVLQVVDATHGLPVAVVGTPSVAQSGTWTVGLSSGQTVAATQSGVWEVGLADLVEIADSQTIGATQSGTWTVGLSAGQTIAAVGSITNPVAVTQSGDWVFDIDSVGIAGAVEVVQDTAADLLMTAHQGGTWSVGIAGTPSVAQSGAWTVGLSGPVEIAAGQTIAAVQSGEWAIDVAGPLEVTQDDASALLCTASQGGTWEVEIADGQGVAATRSGDWSVAVSAPVTVVQDTASSLKAEVTLASGQSLASVGTITDPVAAAQSGSWSVGISGTPTVEIASGQSVGLSAGTNLVGRVASGDDVTHLYDGATALTLKRAKATATASGNTQVVAAVTGKSILVLRYALRFNSTVSATFRSGSSTEISAPFYGVQYGVNSGAACKYGHYATNQGEALNINLGSAGTAAVEVLYVEV
jgi:hypothetical protein